MTTNYWQKYLDIRKENRHFYPREAAEQLGISEMELALSSPDAAYLGGDVKPVVMRLKNLGTVLCIVRNPLAVHEKSGVYENVSMTKTMGIALNVGELDLRILARHWCHAVAIEDKSREPSTHSIQFFDEYGVSCQKVIVKDKEKIGEWEKIVEEFRTEDLPHLKEREPALVKNENRIPDDKLAEFHERWMELKDIHHFDGILETYNVSRLMSYHQAPEGMAVQVKREAIEDMLNKVKEDGMCLMVFVGNRGIFQIQSGKVHNVVRAFGHLNILDAEEERFSLHLKDDELDEVWIVKRPTRDGIVTCLDGFDKYGESRILFFGRRDEGEAELTPWVRILGEITEKYKV